MATKHKRVEERDGKEESQASDQLQFPLPPPLLKGRWERSFFITSPDGACFYKRKSGKRKREQELLLLERVLCLDALVSFSVLFYRVRMGERQQKEPLSLFILLWHWLIPLEPRGSKMSPLVLLDCFHTDPKHFEARGLEAHRCFWITFALTPKHFEARGLEAAKWASWRFWITFAPTPQIFWGEGQRNEPLDAFRLLSHWPPIILRWRGQKSIGTFGLPLR